MHHRLAILASFVVALGVVPSSTVAEPNPVCWWKFDGDANDSSGYSRNGTENGGPTYASGYDGQAIVLDGSVDDVRVYDRALSPAEIQALAPSGEATLLSPADGAMLGAARVLLELERGSHADSVNGHEVFLSDSYDDVDSSAAGASLGMTTNEFYYVPFLEAGKVYYWRIHEVNDLHPDSPWKSKIWSFETREYLVVDDFDSYVSTSGPNEPSLLSMWKDGGTINGGKGSTTDAGTHAALIANWKGTIPAGKIRGDLVDFSDILPTLAEVSGASLPQGVTIDGRSFLPQLRGRKGNPRDWIFCWYQRDPGDQLHRFARNRRWKLYDQSNAARAGKLFDVEADRLEQNPIEPGQGVNEAAQARTRLQAVLDSMK